ADLLSERQLAILTLMQAGYATQQIAEQLFLSPNTVKTHIRLMFDKLGVNNRIECLRAAHQHGYL
ncbi:LuxR C-terminal-related transcriptional regulator, partial [Wenyingzhuangia sp. 1_MG-2023]|nr:LuxR C-terminal-related transcriptional regulator [Wenyingzhuangia sp. 1_MG-2023]